MSDTNTNTDTDTTARPDLEAIGKRLMTTTLAPWLPDWELSKVLDYALRLEKENADLTNRADTATETGRKWRQYCRNLTYELNIADLPKAEVLEIFHDYQQAYATGYANGEYFFRHRIAELEAQLAELSNLPNADSIKVNGRLYAPAIMPALPTGASEGHIAANLSHTVGTEAQSGKGE